MHRPLIIFHFLCCVAFTVFLLGYFETMYPENETCDKRRACKYKGDNVTSCPVASCTGDQDCCELCGLTGVGNITAARNIRIEDPLQTGLVILGIVFVLYCGIFCLNLIRIVTDKFNIKVIAAVTGIALLAMMLLYVIVTVFFFCSLLADISFYRFCHDQLVLLINWTAVCCLLFIDFLACFMPYVKNKNRQNLMKYEALEIEHGGEAALLMNKAQQLKPTGFLFRRIIDWVAGVLVLWWLIVTVYFIGLGQGRWNPV